MWQSSVWQSSVWEALDALEDAPKLNLNVTVTEASYVSVYEGVDNGVETTFDMSTTDGIEKLSNMGTLQVWQSSVWYAAPLASARQRASRHRHRAIRIAHVN